MRKQVSSKTTYSNLLMDDPYPFQRMPKRLTEIASWHGHIPFAFWMVRNLRPRMIVELGVHAADSFSAFCQAVQDTGLNTKVVGVDHWQGDDHAGHYQSSIYCDVLLHVQKNYAEFAELKRMSFADALPEVENGSVDLLHVDGRHGYDDVKEDFLTWEKKLSDRSVVLFHDTHVFSSDFGVWKFFEEIEQENPGRTFKFRHSHGLGVLAHGSELPEPVSKLFALQEEEHTALRDHFAAFGRLITNEGRIDTFKKSLGHLTSPVSFVETLAERDEGSLPDLAATFFEKQRITENELVATRSEYALLADELTAVRGELTAVEGELNEARAERARYENLAAIGTFSFLFKADGRPRKALRRLLYHTSGKPRGALRRAVIKKNGSVRPMFRAWMDSPQYNVLRKAYQPDPKQGPVSATTSSDQAAEPSATEETNQTDTDSTSALKPALFLHIQKTAGTSIQEMARACYGDGVCSHGDFYSRSFAELADYPFISGHFGFAYAEPLLEGRFSFTFLREPIARVLSLYAHAKRSDPVESVLEPIAHDVDLARFLDLSETDEMWRMLLRNNQVWQLAHGFHPHDNRQAHWTGWPLEFLNGDLPDEEVLSRAIANLNRLDYVGFVETFDRDASAIFTALGAPQIELLRSNATHGHVDLGGLTPAELERLHELTTLDRALYEHAWQTFAQPRRD